MVAPGMISDHAPQVGDVARLTSVPILRLPIPDL